MWKCSLALLTSSLAVFAALGLQLPDGPKMPDYSKLKADSLKKWSGAEVVLVGKLTKVIDGNFENRGELLLTHRHDGVDLKADYAQETLKNLSSLWRRPVSLMTKTEGKGLMMRFDGKEHTERKVDP